MQSFCLDAFGQAPWARGRKLLYKYNDYDYYHHYHLGLFINIMIMIIIIITTVGSWQHASNLGNQSVVCYALFCFQSLQKRF